MAKELFGAWCRLPGSRKSVCSPGSTAEWKPLDLPIETLSEGVQQLQLNANTDITDVLEVLWAIVLREFTSSDQITFNRVVDSGKTLTRVFLDLDDDNLASSSHFWSVATLIEARRYGPRTPFSIQAADDSASCDTAIWISEKNTHARDVLLLQPFSCHIVIEVQQERLDGRSLATFWFRSDLISDAEARNFSSTLIHSIRSLPVIYDSDVNDVNLLSPENREDLRSWTLRQAQSGDSISSLVDIVHRAAHAHSHRCAVEDKDGSWTYPELEQACHFLALHFLEVGIKSGDMVLLLREKSKWTVATMIATLMAGAVCVPVDIRQPSERLHRVIEATNARFILTSETTAQRRDEWILNTSLQEICIPTSSPPSQLRSAIAFPAIALDATAFVFFTSGSTGIPKGVVQEHSALAMTVEQISRAMRMGPDTRTFQFSSYSFDVSVGDIFATFLAGGCLCIPSEHQRLDELPQTINAMQATHICLTSTTLAKLTPRDLPALRQVIVGGESLTQEQLQAWYPRVASIYGTTESIIWDTYHAELAPDDSTTNIGYPMGPITTWIVDSRTSSKLIPVGAIGELLVGGPLLSKGYLNDEARTEASFLDKPSWLDEFITEKEAGRLYRTGDLARYNPDGSIQFLGRKDRQIKINGQRVELGDIEFALRQTFPDGTCCAVEMISPKPSHNQEVLAAFVDSSDPAIATSTWTLYSIRNRLATLLPLYMIPSIFVSLPNGIPTTSTGKVDRSKLRQLGISLPPEQIINDIDDGSVKQEPMTPREKLVLGLSRRVLGLAESSPMHINANFFQYGGNSIHAIQLVSLVRKHGLSLSVLDVFENPRLVDLAAALKNSASNTAQQVDDEELVAPFSLLPGDIDHEDIKATAASVCQVAATLVYDVFPCTALQESMLALSTKCSGDYIQQLVIEIPSKFTPKQFQEAYERAANQTHILRCRAFALPKANHRTHFAVIDEPTEWLTASEIDRHASQEFRTLSNGCLGDRLVRCSIVVDATQRQYFVWTIHHALFDGWSLSLMLDELERQLLGQTVSPLLPFQNFVHHLQKGIDYNACESFWRSYLEGAEQLNFPPSLPSSYEPCEKVITLSRIVSNIEWPVIGVTPSTVVQGAWALLLAQYTGSSDLCFGSTVVGRHAAIPGIEHIVGPTITTVPLRVRVEFCHLVSRYLQELQLHAIRTVPYEQLSLAGIAKVSADAGDACAFQALLVVQPADDSSSDADTRVFDRSKVRTIGALQTYAVTLQCWLGRSRTVELQMEIDEALVSRLEGERMLTQLEFILHRLCKSSKGDVTLGTVILCGDVDEGQISHWNAKTPITSSNTIVELISMQASAQPNRLAVDAWDGSLTYGQLEFHAGQLAQQVLLDRTRRPGHPTVVVCLEKSYFAIVALVAAFKAGAVCIQIDPAQPNQRVKTIIERSEAHLALTDEAQARRLEPWIRTITLSKDTCWLSVDAAVPAFRPPLLTDDACIVFTSGSTGEPKGICWNHYTVATTALALGAQFEFSHFSRIFQFSSYDFDVSIHETTAALAYGGCVCVPSEKSRQDALQQAIVSCRANTIILTPSVAQLLTPEDMPELSTVVLGGEPLPTHAASKWSQSKAMYNWYGPAECSLATACRVSKSWRQGDVGVGTLTVTWIVHPQNHDILQPIGAVGELLLQGPGVASRYFNDTDRTAQSFIRPPQWWQPCQPGVTESRLYKTGDLARYSEDGSIIFLGRKDTQVKVRGRRVELGEIQTRLQEILGSDVTVIVDLINRGSHRERTTLAAFIQSSIWNCHCQDDRIAPVEWTQSIETQLHEKLPMWMVPTVFFQMSKLPQTSTGKTDLRKLRSLGSLLTAALTDRVDRSSHGPTVESSTEAETVLRGLWAEVLGLSVDQIGLTDHFVQLGGNSIDAMRLTAAAGKNGYSLSVRTIFTKPRLADLAKEMQRLSADGYSNMAHRVAPFALIRDAVDPETARDDAASQCGVQKDQIVDIFPCTPMQTAFLALTSKTSGDYVSRNVWHIQEPLSLFKSSWATVVAETPILRTRIVDVLEESFCQAIIDEPLAWNEAYLDVDEYLHHDHNLTMGLGTPLVRWGIVPDLNKEGPSFTFIWTIHHSIYDGWSFKMILDQVERAHKKTPLAPSVPFQGFISYIASSERETATTQFWKQKLDGAVALPFPVLPSSQFQPRATSTVEYQATLSQSSAQDNLGVFTWTTILHATWSLVLARYSRSTEVIFGITSLGRQVPVLGVSDMIGPTIATVPARFQWSGTDSIKSFLQAVQGDSIEVIPHEQIGLQKIRRLGTGPEEACKFQTLLIVQQPQESQVDDARLFSDFKGDESFAAFSSTALVLRCYPLHSRGFKNATSEIQLKLDFDSRVIQKEQAHRILRQVNHTLVQLLGASPSTRVFDLPLLSSSDAKQILEWNENPPESANVTVNEIFHDMVQRFPTAPAIHAWDTKMSYEELDRYAINVSQHLASRGLCAGQCVPLYFEKSAWTIVAIFAALKSGCSVVLLDPKQPKDRLRFIVNQINAPILVTSAQYEDCARRLVPALPVVIVDASIAKSIASTQELLQPAIDPSFPVYVVFTSGSTGVPKGVLISHANMCSALKHRNPRLSYKPGDRVLDGVSYAFDVCWGNILFTLCSGACLCVPKTIDEVGVSLTQFNITVAGTVPSIARLLDYKQYPNLKTLILGGESPHLSDLEDWMERVDIFNSYGPAECTVSVCAGLLNKGDRVHVGHGMGATTWIVDDTTGSNSLASIGGIGELWIEGPQVGLGYMNDSDNSSAAFIEGDPAWLSGIRTVSFDGPPTKQDRRFYRTGDLAQYYPDGMIRLIGRRDTQVKLRGQRIELEEVEHHVKQYLPFGIELAAEVVVPRSSPSRQFLIVFIVQNSARGISGEEVKNLSHTVRTRISQALPSYMCPSAFIPISVLPRLAAAKINRKQLRKIGSKLSVQELTGLKQSHADPIKVKVPPQTPMEQRLCELWATTLGLIPSVIGSEDSFLQLEGGDSISAMRLVQLGQKNGLRLSVADVFSHPTLSEMATKVIIEDHTGELPVPFSLWKGPWKVAHLKKESAVRCGVDPRQIEDVFPCTALQEGLLALTSRDLNLYVCRETFELLDNIDISRLQKAWEDVVSVIPILRTRIIDLYPHGLHQVIIDEQISWNSCESHHRFDLGSRLVYWDVVDKMYSRELIWTIHHSLYDGWSVPRILEQVERAYSRETIQSSLPMQPFIRLISAVDESTIRAFWNAQLFEAPLPSFPLVSSRSIEQKASQSCTCYLPGLEWPTGVDVAPTAWIRAALALLIGHILNTDDITFGTIVSGRQVPLAGIQDIVGPTIATVPIRIQIDWTATIHNFVRQLQQQATEMIPFEHIGLPHLRQISEDAKRGSQFHTLLNVQPAENEASVSRIWKRKNVESQGQFNSYALILDCELGKAGLFLQLDFDEEIVTSVQARRLIKQLETVLLQLDRRRLNLSKQLSDFCFVSEHDLSEIWKWNAEVPEEVPVCLQDLIDKHVEKHPDSLAVDAWDGQLTYEALDCHSTNLASYLRSEHGNEVGSGIVVALCFEKSMWTIVGALAVMKTGSAFTLMDIGNPEERLRAIASQVNQSLIISSSSSFNLASRLARHVVVVDLENLSRIPPSLVLFSNVQANENLYIVFTSGSTGTPKGAVITHSNFSSAVRHQGTFLGYNEQTRVYDFASYSFDIAVSNMLHCLAAGGCICIPSDAERKQGQLAESMERMRVNLIDLTPSIARTLEPTAVPSLKTLILGGETALRSDIIRWASHVRVLNGIGQAECTVTTTMAEMDPAIPGTPSIGKAMGTTTWVVSPADHNQLVAVGAVGELVVEGPLVGAGYLNDDDKTSAAFIRKPSWLSSLKAPEGSARHARVYKTGDLVRYDTEGSLYFVGRKDAQTKIRGQRIELEEVEYHVQRLLFSLSVNATVVAEAIVLSEASFTSPVLVVFVFSPDMVKSDARSDLGFRALDSDSFPPRYRQELNSRLECELPSAMVPFVYVPVNQIPLSLTGKTDRKRLRSLGGSLTSEELRKLRGVEDIPKRSPNTPIERRMRDLWAEVLAKPVKHIGIDDNFVQLGGDSISAMRLVTLARSRGLILDPKNLLVSATALSDLALMATFAPTSAKPEKEPPFCNINTDDIDGFLRTQVAPYIDCSPSNVADVLLVTEFQAQCVKAAINGKPPSFWNYFYVDFQLSDVSVSALRAASRAVAMHFPILRTIFVAHKVSFLQVVTKNWVPDFVEFHSTTETVAEASERIVREDWQSADLSTGTRFAQFMLVLADSEPACARLVMRLSHALYDAISVDLLFQGLTAAIEKREMPPSGSFASFVHHLVLTRNSAARYWGRLLAGSSMTPISDKPTTDGISRGSPYSIKRNVNLKTPLPQGITAATFFTACWAAVIASTTQQSDVVFGRLVSGRGVNLGVIEEPVAGPCLNIIPVRATWPIRNNSASWSPCEVLATIQQQQLEGMPFESSELSQTITPTMEWPADTTYGSVFQYQNINEDTTAHFLGTSIRLGIIPVEFRPEQLWVLVKPLEQSFDIRLFCSTTSMSKEKAGYLASQFCKYVERGGMSR